MTIETELLIIALVTTFIGSIVRAVYEIKNKTHNRIKMVFIIVTSLVMGILTYETVRNFDLRQWIGIFGVLGGISGIGIIDSLVEKLPSILMDKLNRILGGRNETYGDNDDTYSHRR